MTKLAVPALFELSKALATQAGQELQEALQYLSIVSDQVVRALRQGVSLADNLDCLTSNVTLSHNKAQVVNANGRSPVGIVPIRVISTSVSIPSIKWSINSSNEVSVTATFLTDPGSAQQVVLLILF
jgi:hypothetical protein